MIFLHLRHRVVGFGIFGFRIFRGFQLFEHQHKFRVCKVRVQSFKSGCRVLKVYRPNIDCNGV